MAWDRKVPFTVNGDQEHYPSLYRTSMWKDNHEFQATMEFQRFNRGRSAAYAVMRDTSTKRTVTIFLSDFDHVVRHMTRGTVTGRWTFTKKGQNYGCKLIG